MKKIFYFAVLIVLVSVGLYFFLHNLNANSIDITYKEPTPGFFDKALISPSDIIVKITNTGFEPGVITIKKGEKVTWVNETRDLVWPASDPHPSHTDYHGFDTQLPMKVGEAWSFTFSQVGKWSYHDHLSPTTRRGSVSVKE